MIVKRKKPEFFTPKLVGLYIIIVAVCILSHVGYIKNLNSDTIDVNHFKIIDNGVEVVQATVSNMLDFVNNGVKLSGGGVIGAIFASILCGLLTLNGTMVVSITLIICGTIMFTGVSIYDLIKKTREGTNRIKEKVHREKKPKEELEMPEVTDANQGVVISNIDELKNNPKEPKEDVSVVKSVDDGNSDNKNYKYPPITLLSKPSKGNGKANQDAIKQNVPILVQVLKDFGIEGKVVSAHVGPAVTQYELEIKAGTKVNKILSLNREIALALAAKDVRIQAPIPGKSTIGVELPNKSISMVNVREVLSSVPSNLSDSKLLSVLGRDIMGEPRWMEINKTPHLLVAGSTGSGKSVCINSILASILMRSKPDEVKLVLVDLKRLSYLFIMEFHIYLLQL